MLEVLRQVVKHRVVAPLTSEVSNTDGMKRRRLEESQPWNVQLSLINARNDDARLEDITAFFNQTVLY